MAETALKHGNFSEEQETRQPSGIDAPAPAAPGARNAGTDEIVADDSEPENESSSVRKGRPRSPLSKKAILKATNSLLLHMSVQELSIEAIAKRAKVGKTTIYRWWPNKTAVVMEALISQPGMQSPLPTPKNNAEAIVMQLEKLIRLLHSKNGETISQLFSEAQNDETARKIFSSAFLTPLIDAIEFSVEQGIRDGEFRRDLTPRMAVDMLCGPIFFRLMAHSADLNESFREAYPKEAVRQISA